MSPDTLVVISLEPSWVPALRTELSELGLPNTMHHSTSGTTVVLYPCTYHSATQRTGYTAARAYVKSWCEKRGAKLVVVEEFQNSLERANSLLKEALQCANYADSTSLYDRIEKHLENV